LLVTLFALIIGAGATATSLIGESQFDRYFVVVVPCVGIALLHRARLVSGVGCVPAAVVASIAVLVLGVVSWDVTWLHLTRVPVYIFRRPASCPVPPRDVPGSATRRPTS